MATQRKTLDDRQYFVRLEIGVSAQFFVDTHQNVTYENLKNYFCSVRFSGNRHIPLILQFLNDTESMGCRVLGYSNPLSASSIPYVEFEMCVPGEKYAEFEAKYARYFCFL